MTSIIILNSMVGLHPRISLPFDRDLADVALIWWCSESAGPYRPEKFGRYAVQKAREGRRSVCPAVHGKVMKSPLSVLLMAILLSALPGLIQAETYRWVDKNGVVNLTDSLPAGQPVDTAQVEPDAQHGQSAAEIPLPDMDVEIRGVVQDTSGNRLQGVTMTIVERHPVPGRLSSKTVRKEKKVDGDFAISCRNCPIVKLRFHAPGYTSTTVNMEFTAEEDAEIARSLEDAFMGRTMPTTSTPVRITRDNIVVVMEEKGRFPRLTRIQGEVGLMQDGPLRVLAGKPPELSQQPYSYAVKQFNGGATDKGMAMLLPSLSGASYQTLARAHEANTLHTRSDRLYIELTGMEDGFIRVTPTARVRSDKMKNMKQAPESGYQKRLSIAMNDKEGVYFYCRIGSYYGKGWITHEPRMASRSGLFTHIEILMNRDGGRDLKSEY